MTITSAIKSLKTWGVRGAIDFAFRWPTMYRLKHSDKSHGAAPSRGLTLIGPFSSHSGNSNTMRNFARMLKLAGIPFQTFDMNRKPTIPKTDYDDILTPRPVFDLGRYDHVIELFTNHTPIASNRLHALLAFWEFGSGFDFAFPDSALSGLPLIAMSDFNEHLFRSCAMKANNIYKIRHPLVFSCHTATPSKILRPKYRIRDDAYVVFFNFDYGSSYYRKNPEGVMRAFAKAFPQDSETLLLLKTSNAEKHPATSKRLHSLAKSLGLKSDRLLLIEGAVPQSDMSGFFKTCDVYISLHRGEGFGIGMTEAMAYGKPVIATDYSANTEFCRETTSIPVPYKLVAPQQHEIDNPAYSHVTLWADPDIEFAAEALRKCKDHPAYAQKIGTAGNLFVTEYFSLENFKRDVENFLDSPAGNTSV